MFSVIIPLFNKQAHIGKTIESVLAQSYRSFEVIIVNDGSTDDSINIVKTFNDDRIRIVNQVNQGVSVARNTGVNNSNFEFVTFLDSDDLWLPNHLEVLSELIGVYGSVASFFSNNFARLYHDGNKKMNRRVDELHTGIVNNYFKIAIKKAIVNSSCVCISKNAFKEVQGFNSSLRNGEDIDLWVRLARKYKLAYSSICTSVYVLGTLNNSSSNRKKTGFYGYYIKLSDCVNFYDFIFHLKIKIVFGIKRHLKRYK